MTVVGATARDDVERWMFSCRTVKGSLGSGAPLSELEGGHDCVARDRSQAALTGLPMTRFPIETSRAVGNKG